MLVDTELGVAHVVATQVAVALRPGAPRSFTMTVSPDPHMLRDGVSADLGSVVLAFAAVCLMIGAVGIASTMTGGDPRTGQ